MKTKEAHIKYLKSKGEFKIKCSIEIFKKEEVEVLKKFGNWFNGLSNGDLSPFTDEQKKFTNVFMNESLPNTYNEKIWWKYLRRLEIEQENPNIFKLDYHIKEEGFHTREDYYILHPYRRNRK